VSRKRIKRKPGTQSVESKNFRLAEAIKHIQRRAAAYEGRLVRIGPLVFFSTETGDAWVLDPEDKFAARLAREADPEPIDFQETEKNFAIAWKGYYRIEDDAFIYEDGNSGRIIAILGYPTAEIARFC
jgi:hypothetical protein